MGVITAITASPRHEGRFVVEVDGRPFATVDLAALDRLKLAIGRPIDGVASEVERAEAELKTLDRALTMLAFRPRSRAELRRSLVRKGEEPARVDAALERLTALGLVDDAAYARALARSKVLGPGFSRRRLQQEMFKRGVAREVGDEAIAEVLSDEAVDEDAVIERVARKKLRTLEQLEPATRRRRLYAYLARRGFESDEIRRVVETMSRMARADEEVDPATGDS